MGEYWLADPERTLEAERRLWTGYIDLWSSSMKRMMGEPARPRRRSRSARPALRRPRLAGEPVLRFHQAGLPDHQPLGGRPRRGRLGPRSAHPAEGRVLRQADRQRARAVELRPHQPGTPRARRCRRNGANLVRGMHMLAEDIKAGGGDLAIRQTSTERLQARREPRHHARQGHPPEQALPDHPATTPRPRRCWRGPSSSSRRGSTSSTSSTSTAEKSFIRWCVDQGHTVFVISWVNPDKRHAREELRALHDVAASSRRSTSPMEATGADGVNAVGYCVGGTILAVSLAYMAATGRRAHQVGDLLRHPGRFQQRRRPQGLRRRGADRRHRECKMKSARLSRRQARWPRAFNMLRPNDLIWPYVISNYFRARSRRPSTSSTGTPTPRRMPAANHAFYLRHCYLQNDLATGGWRSAA